MVIALRGGAGGSCGGGWISRWLMAGALLNFLDLLVALSLSTDGMMISVRALLLRRTIMRWAIRRAGFRLLIRHSFQLGFLVIRDSLSLTPILGNHLLFSSAAARLASWRPWK